jgi:hypothetical protein
MNSINRRAFLSSSILTTGSLVAAAQQMHVVREPTPPHTPPKRITAYQSLDIAVVHAAATTHALAVASVMRGNATSQDFKNAAAALAEMRTNWLAAGLDTRLIPGFNRVNESDLTVARMPVAAITARIRTFNPAVTQTQIAASLHSTLSGSVVNGVDYKTTTLQTCRAGGMSTLIGDGITYLNRLAAVIPVPKISASTHHYVPQMKIDPSPSGGGGDGCAALDIGTFALGLAAITLTVMTDGLDLLAAAGWEAVAGWAGLSSAGLDIENHLLC